MFKKISLIFSILILTSMILGACSSAPGMQGADNSSGLGDASLSTQAMTEVASIVNNASMATQNAAAKTPIIAGGSTGTPVAPARTPAGIGSSLTTQSGGTSSATQSALELPPVSTSASTPIPKTPESTPGVMKPVLDWSGAWAEFLVSIPSHYYMISIDDLASRIDAGTAPFLVDVRDPSELAEFGFIKGAVNIPYELVLSNLEKLPAMDQEIVIYSGVGHRGTIIMSGLRLLGYTNVTLLDGGMSSWLKAKKPAEIGTPPTPAAGSVPNVDPKKVQDLESFIATGTYGIEANDLNNWLAGDPKPIVLDVRERTESSLEGAIQGSAQVPLPALFDNLNILSPDKVSPIVVIDSSGHRGTIAMMALRMIGYSNVRSLFGGYEAWVAAGLPVVK